MGEVLNAAPRARVVARISGMGAAVVLCAALSACGGRVANPVPERTALDAELSCRHVIAEKRKLKKRVADLRHERKANRRRSLTRVPGAVVSGNPFSAIFFADPSVAIYKEINAAGRRQRVLDQLLREKGCIAPAQSVAQTAAGADDSASTATTADTLDADAEKAALDAEKAGSDQAAVDQASAEKASADAGKSEAEAEKAGTEAKKIQAEIDKTELDPEKPTPGDAGDLIKAEVTPTQN